MTNMRKGNLTAKIITRRQFCFHKLRPRKKFWHLSMQKKFYFNERLPTERKKEQKLYTEQRKNGRGKKFKEEIA